MQPTYIPWAGYFNLISQAQVVIFLDDVQFSKSSWQNRNRVLANGKEFLISIPTQQGPLSQKICDVLIQDRENWRKKHIKLLEHNYLKRPYGSEVLQIMQDILSPQWSRLADLNIHLIKTFSNKLGLAPRFYRSSELDINGQRSERLIQMCLKFDCQTYLSPKGASDYLEKDGLFKNSPIKLEFQDYTPDLYEQGTKDFVSHLSIVDVVANLGWDHSLTYIQTKATQ